MKIIGFFIVKIKYNFLINYFNKIKILKKFLFIIKLSINIIIFY